MDSLCVLGEVSRHDTASAIRVGRRNVLWLRSLFHCSIVFLIMHFRVLGLCRRMFQS